MFHVNQYGDEHHKYISELENYSSPFILNWRNPRPPLSGPVARVPGPLFFFLLHHKRRGIFSSQVYYEIYNSDTQRNKK